MAANGPTLAAVQPNPDGSPANAERARLEEQHLGLADWRRWGPYLAERAWGTVREDYSAEGNAWDYFGYDQARARAYRWSEDGMGGICDSGQRLCLAFALWNGRDPYLKERAFGLTAGQGNRGEDVKECYFYRDATPSHSWLSYLYKYPQAAFPYAQLIAENARRGRKDPPFGIIDTGVFAEQRYWDLEVLYAKASPEEIHARVRLHNRGPDAATVHLLPTLWFRNTWSWGEGGERPHLTLEEAPEGAAWAVRAGHPDLGTWHLYGAQPATVLFTENESNVERLWGSPNAGPYVKDAFHRRVVEGETAAVNPAQAGTKFAAWSRWELAPGAQAQVDLVLSRTPLVRPFALAGQTLAARQAEAGAFYDDLLPGAEPEDRGILRQALAGMIWGKQFYHYDVDRWLFGDRVPPPDSRRQGRNRHWRHLKAADVVSVPDTWEYPWFSAWGLSFHCAALALVDLDFAKDQIELLVSDRYLHPNGQIPAYEWAFDAANPPVQAMGALKVFRAEQAQRGAGDLGFLARVFPKLLLHFGWWMNRRDAEGRNLLEGGFLGLDDVCVYDQGQSLPAGFRLKPAEAAGWMAMFSLNLTVMALELCTRDPTYEDMAIHCYKQFLAIAATIAGNEESGTPSLWDPQAGFFKDLLACPDGTTRRLEVYTWAGLVPLFATEVLAPPLLADAPRFRALLAEHRGGRFQGLCVCACPDSENERGEHLLSLVDPDLLPRVLARVLDEGQFLSRHGVRSVSRRHANHGDLGRPPGLGRTLLEYVPGEADSGHFGGNANWRGPVWLPVNYALIQALEKYHRFLGPGFRVQAPCLEGRDLNLGQVAALIAGRLVDLYRRDRDRAAPALRRDAPFQDDPLWQDLLWFYEYFHGDTGQGLGAAHQTGWTGLLANLVMRRYRGSLPNGRINPG